MELSNPRLTRIFDRRVKEDDLILDANLVDQWFEGQRPFNNLYFLSEVEDCSRREGTHLLILRLLVSASFIGNVSSSTTRIRILCSVELFAPYLDDVCQPSQEDAFYSLVELRHPVFEIRVSLEV